MRDDPDFDQRVADILDNPGFKIEVAEILHRKHRWRWRALFCCIVGIAISVFLLYTANKHRISDISVNRRARIAEIQASRVESCKANLDSVFRVASSFFPPEGKRTPEQQQRLLNLRIFTDGLKNRCPQQVKLHPLPGGHE